MFVLDVEVVFFVEYFVGFEFLFGCGDDVGIEYDWCVGWFFVECGGSNGDVEFEFDYVDWLV